MKEILLMLESSLTIAARSRVDVNSKFTGIRFPVDNNNSIYYFPFLAVKGENRFLIVGNPELFDVFKIDNIGLYVINETTSLALTKALIYYYEFQKPLNIVEKSNILKLCETVGISKIDIVKELCPLMNLPQNSDSVYNLMFVNKLPDILKRYIIEKSMSLKQLRVFQRCGTDFDWILQLIDKGNASLSTLLEVINHVWEISRRDDKLVTDVIEEAGINNLSGPEDIHSIRMNIHRMRFPTLNRMNNKVEKIIESLRLDRSIQIKWDHTFEQDGFELKIYSRKQDEFRRSIEHIQSKDMTRLFDSVDFQ